MVLIHVPDSDIELELKDELLDLLNRIGFPIHKMDFNPISFQSLY